MLKLAVISFSGLMMTVGLLGFFVPNLYYVVQFDSYQSFVYMLVGAAGLKFGFGSATDLIRRRYLDAVAIVNLTLLMIGLSFPNLGDIIHLEVPEHVFHAAVGMTAALVSDYFRKRTV